MLDSRKVQLAMILGMTSLLNKDLMPERHRETSGFKLPTKGLEPAPKKDKAKEKLRRQRKARSKKKRGY